MTNNDLIERYIYAVTKRMSKTKGEDVSSELRTLIDDMLEERCGEVTPTEKDVRVVLTELGTPNELYEKYDDDSKKCLIGSPYYTTYKFVLKIVLMCTFFGMFVVWLITQLTSPPALWIESVTSLISMVFSSLISAFAFVTLLFSIFYHKDIDIGQAINLNDLPPIPKKSETISKWESIIGICLSVIFLIVFLFAPQILIGGFFNGEKLIPLFNTEVIKSTWYIIVAFSAVGIFDEIIKLLEGRYTKKVMLSTIITNVISAILSVIWLSTNNILNPEFLNNINIIFPGNRDIVQYMFTNFQYFFLAVIIFFLLLDIGITTYKTLKSK